MAGNERRRLRCEPNSTLAIRLVPAELLAEPRTGLSLECLVPCQILPAEPELQFAFNVTRQQYQSTEILVHMVKRQTPATTRLLGVTMVDLYLPISYLCLW